MRVSWEETRKKDGRRHAVKGLVVGWVSRNKKVCAIVLIRRSLTAVSIDELKVVRSKGG